MIFSNEIIQKVWEIGQENPPTDPRLFRKDACGAWIRRNEYGTRDSTWGWEVDHIYPGGGEKLSNLQPLHWKNKVAKRVGHLKCVVMSSGNKNVEKPT